MKTVFTLKRWSYLLVFLAAMFAQTTSHAQRTAPQAKCAGFTAKVQNGSVLNLCSGQSITLMADPVDAGYTYQWQVQTTAGGPFTSISGANGSTHKVSALGAYRVYISTGSCIDTSGITSVINILPQPGKITAEKTATICPGENGGLITGTQVPGVDIGVIKFQWQKRVNNGSWEFVPAETNINYLVGPVLKTTDIRRVASDNCGNVAYSNTVTLTTTPDLMPGDIAPADQSIHAGEVPAMLTSTSAASGGSGSLGYQWQSSLFERGPFADIAGATSATYSPGALSQTTYYKRVTTDKRCYTTAQSSVIMVTVVDAILNAGKFTIYSGCVFPGGTPSPLQTSDAPTGGKPPYTVQWQSSTDNTNFTDISGANGSTYQPGSLTQTTYFRKKVTDAAGTVAYSSIETISYVSSVLIGGTIKATANVACLGSNPAEILSVTSPQNYAERLSFQWQYKNATTGDWKNIPNQIRESLLPDPITEKTKFRRLAMDMCGSNTRTVPSNEVEIDIRPALIPGDIEPTSQTVRPGQTPRPLNSVTNPSGGTGAYNVMWETSDLAVGPFTTINSANANSYQPTTIGQTAYYRRVVMDKNCLATKYTYVVEVYLKKDTIVPCTLAGSQCVFPGQQPGVIATTTSPTGGTPPYSYSWETKPILSTTWSVIPGATHMDYQPPVLTQTTQYRLKVTDAFGDFAYTAAFTVEYHTAALNPGTIALNSSPVLCAGTPAGKIESVTPVTGYGENPMYQWQMMVAGGSWMNISGANDESYQPGAITQTTYFRRAVTDMCGNATRTAYSNEVKFEIPLSINLKAGLVDGPFITCSGTAPGTISSVLDACSGSNVHYQWEKMEGGSWKPISGATGASYTPGAITANTKYRRKVVDDCGGSGYSNVVEIFVYPAIEPGVIGTTSQTVCANVMPAKISLLSNCHYTNGTVTYQWQSATAMAGPFSNIAGATTPEYQPASGTVSKYYRLMVKSTTCSAVAYTNVASVMVGACRNSAPIADNNLDASSKKVMKVYPNPLTGNAFEVKVETKGKVKGSLLNANGLPIQFTLSQIGSGLMRVSFVKLPSKGMYILTITDENSSWTKRIVVL